MRLFIILLLLGFVTEAAAAQPKKKQIFDVVKEYAATPGGKDKAAEQKQIWSYVCKAFEKGEDSLYSASAGSVAEMDEELRKKVFAGDVVIEVAPGKYIIGANCEASEYNAHYNVVILTKGKMLRLYDTIGYDKKLDKLVEVKKEDIYHSYVNFAYFEAKKLFVSEDFSTSNDGCSVQTYFSLVENKLQIQRVVKKASGECDPDYKNKEPAVLVLYDRKAGDMVVPAKEYYKIKHLDYEKVPEIKPEDVVEKPVEKVIDYDFYKNRKSPWVE